MIKNNIFLSRSVVPPIEDIIDKANRTMNALPNPCPAAKMQEVVAEADVVFAVWPDESEPRGVGQATLKGENLLMQIAAAKRRADYWWTALRQRNREAAAATQIILGLPRTIATPNFESALDALEVMTAHEERPPSGLERSIAAAKRLGVPINKNFEDSLAEARRLERLAQILREAPDEEEPGDPSSSPCSPDKDQ